MAALHLHLNPHILTPRKPLLSELSSHGKDNGFMAYVHFGNSFVLYVWPGI